MGLLSHGPIPKPHVPQSEGLQIITDHRLSMLCGVVERPDHHCGDDLALLCSIVRPTLLPTAVAPAVAESVLRVCKDVVLLLFLFPNQQRWVVRCCSGTMAVPEFSEYQEKHWPQDDAICHLVFANVSNTRIVLLNFVLHEFNVISAIVLLLLFLTHVLSFINHTRNILLLLTRRRLTSYVKLFKRFLNKPVLFYENSARISFNVKLFLLKTVLFPKTSNYSSITTFAEGLYRLNVDPA